MLWWSGVLLPYHIITETIPQFHIHPVHAPGHTLRGNWEQPIKTERRENRRSNITSKTHLQVDWSVALSSSQSMLRSCPGFRASYGTQCPSVRGEVSEHTEFAASGADNCGYELALCQGHLAALASNSAF